MFAGPTGEDCVAEHTAGKRDSVCSRTRFVPAKLLGLQESFWDAPHATG